MPSTTMIDFLETTLGLSGGEQVNDWYRVCCPFHNERTPSFGVELVYPHRFNCFACGKGGNIVGLVMQLLGIRDGNRARQLLLPILLKIPDFDPEWESEFTPLDPVILPFYQDALLRSRRAKRYLASRGISLSLAAKFGLGYSKQKRAIVVPLQEPFSARVEGLFFRGLDGSFKSLEGAKRRLVFASPNLRDATEVFVAEGWADALKLYQYRRIMGYPTAAVLSIQQAQVMAHIKLFLCDYTTVVWALDNDEAGSRGFEKGLQKSKSHHLRVVFDNKDPAASRVFNVESVLAFDKPELPPYLK